MAGTQDPDHLDHQDVGPTVLKKVDTETKIDQNPENEMMKHPANDQVLHERSGEMNPSTIQPDTKESSMHLGKKESMKSLEEDSAMKIESDKSISTRNQETGFKKDSLTNQDPPKSTSDAVTREASIKEQAYKKENTEPKEDLTDSGSKSQVIPGMQTGNHEVQAEPTLKRDRKSETDRRFIRRPSNLRKK